MKNREVKAILAAFAFSAATMTACGVYGSPEVSVYGSPEYFGVDESYEDENADLTAGEKYQNWESGREQKNGYDDATNRELKFHGVTFKIPEYMQEGSSSDDTAEYVAESTDTDMARLSLTRQSYDTSSYENFEQFCEMLIGTPEVEADTADVSVVNISGIDVKVVTRVRTTNGENVISYEAQYILETGDAQADLITLQMSVTEGCEYSYRDDFMQIVTNSVIEAEN